MSKNGEIRSGDKAELLICFKKISAFGESQSTPPIVDAACLDGLLIVNMTKPNESQSFEMYCKDCFTLQLKKYSEAYCAESIDFFFDNYISVSLKTITRRNRGKGVRN